MGVNYILTVIADFCMEKTLKNESSKVRHDERPAASRC